MPKNKSKKQKRVNIYFRQTPKSFAADRQTRVFSRVKRSVEQVRKITKGQFERALMRAKRWK